MKLYLPMWLTGWVASLLALVSLPLAADSARVGRFDSTQDINHPLRAGTASFDADRWEYRVTGGGSNMWFGADAFHFVSTKVKGNVVLAAEMSWPEPSKQAHRKAGLMLREDLSPGSRYVDIVLHGDGLISLQFRAERDGPTREVQAAVKGAPQLRLERWGDFFSASFVNAKGGWETTGCGVQLALPSGLLAGLLVCSHDDQVAETAVFRRVQLAGGVFPSGEEPKWRCALEVVPIASKDRRVVLAPTNRVEFPLWSSDGRSLLFQADGELLSIPVTGGEASKAGLESFPNRRQSDDNSVSGGRRYYRSKRDGLEQIWVQEPNQAKPKLLTDDGSNNWHPRTSADGRWLAWTAWRADAVPGLRPAPVGLRLMNLQNQEVQVLAQSFAAKDCMEINPWSPDSRQIAFVSWQPDLTGWLRSKDQYERDIAAFENSDRTNPPPRNGVLFLGSSTIRMWKTLREDFPGHALIQRGYGGSLIVDSTYFADRVVFPYSPRVIVFYAGDNDLRDHRSPERVLRDFREFVATIHARLPRTQIAFLAVRPCKARWAWVDKTREANRLVARFCARDSRLTYLDTFTLTLDSHGQPREGWFEKDNLHLNREGYAAWARVIRPWLDRQQPPAGGF